jgi:hypothetical protein
MDNVGRVADEALQFAARENRETEHHWNKIRAVLAGTPENPGLALELQQPQTPGDFEPYSRATLVARSADSRCNYGR